MRYTLAELLEDKKLRSAAADQANRKELDFEDGNGVFALDFRGQSLYINHRRTYDTLCELGGEKLLKKLLKEEKTCIVADPKDDKKGLVSIQGTDKYFLLTNAGPTKVFTSILRGIAAWAKMDKHFDLDLVCVSTAEDAEEEDADLQFDWEQKELHWFHNGEECGGLYMEATRNGVLSEKDGKPIFVDAETGREIILYTVRRGGGMVSCEPLRAEDEETAPIMGYKYQTEEGGKWGFISRHLVCISEPRYDEVVATEQYVAAWTKKGEENIDLQFSVCVEQEESGLRDDWLITWSPVFEDVPEYYTPLYDAVLEEQKLDDGRKASLYRPSQWAPFGLFGCSSAVRPEVQRVRYEKGFVAGEKAEWKVPACELSLEKCLQLDKEQDSDLQLIQCVVEPEWNGVGTYIVRKDGYWALANVDVRKAPKVRHLSTPLAYTKMEQPENWRQDWVLLERFGKKGIYNWLKEEFVASCEYEEIGLENGYYVLKRHGKVRKLNSYGRWVEEARPACPKCKTELVQGALYCHMCGVSLTEPDKELKQEVPPAPVQEAPKAEPKAEAKPEPAVEAKPEPVEEAPKPVEPPKPAPKPPVAVPTADTFKEEYREWGRGSHMRKKYNDNSRGELEVCVRWNDDERDDTDPEHYLYANLEIRRKQSSSAVSGLQGMKAYALVKDGIIYEKDGVIWFLHVSGEKRKVGERKNVLEITALSDHRVVVSYAKRYWPTATNEHRDEMGYTFEAWYNVYEVDIGTEIMLLPKDAAAEVPVKVPTSKNFHQEFATTSQGSRVANGRLIVIVKSDGEKIPGDHSPEQYMYETFSIKDLKTLEVVAGLNNLSAYALGDNGIFYAKNDEIWYLTTDGNRRKLGEQKHVIKLTNAGSGKLMVEYVESYRQTNWEEDVDSELYAYEACFDGYDVHTKKVFLEY